VEGPHDKLEVKEGRGEGIYFTREREAVKGEGKRVEN